MAFSLQDSINFDKSRKKLSKYHRLKASMFDYLYGNESPWITGETPEPKLAGPATGVEVPPVIDDVTARDNNNKETLRKVEALRKRLEDEAEADRLALAADEAARVVAAKAAADAASFADTPSIIKKIEANIPNVPGFSKVYQPNLTRTPERIRFAGADLLTMGHARIVSMSNKVITIEFKDPVTDSRLGVHAYDVTPALLILLFYVGTNAITALKTHVPTNEDLINLVEIITTSSVKKDNPNVSSLKNDNCKFRYLFNNADHDQTVILEALKDYPVYSHVGNSYNVLGQFIKKGAGLKRLESIGKSVAKIATRNRTAVLLGELQAGNNNPRILQELAASRKSRK